MAAPAATGSPIPAANPTPLAESHSAGASLYLHHIPPLNSRPGSGFGSRYRGFFLLIYCSPSNARSAHVRLPPVTYRSSSNYSSHRASDSSQSPSCRPCSTARYGGHEHDHAPTGASFLADLSLKCHEPGGRQACPLVPAHCIPQRKSQIIQMPKDGAAMDASGSPYPKNYKTGIFPACRDGKSAQII